MHTIHTVLWLLSLSCIVLALAPVVTDLLINKTLISHDFPGPENEIFRFSMAHTSPQFNLNAIYSYHREVESGLNLTQ